MPKKWASNFCSFQSCKNNSKARDFHFFRFPKENDRCRAWVDACKNDKLLGIPVERLYKSFRICSSHFNDWCFMNINIKNKLIHNAIPDAPDPRSNPSKKDHTTAPADLNITVSSFPFPCLLAHLLDTPNSSQSLNCKPLEETNHSNPEIVGKSAITVASSSKTDEITTITHKHLTNSCPEIITPTSSSKTDERAIDVNKFMTNCTCFEVKDPLLTVVTLCCTDKKEATAFHRFLQDPKQRMRWIVAVKRMKLKPCHMIVLCPKHYFSYQKDCNFALRMSRKENAVPNSFPLHPMYYYHMGKRLFKKWEECIPVCHKEISNKEEIHDLHCNPETIEKIYVKIVWYLPVSKIARRRHSLQAKTTSSTLPLSSTTHKKHFVSHVAKKKLKKSWALSTSNSISGESVNISDKSGVKRMSMIKSLHNSENERTIGSKRSPCKTKEKDLIGSESESGGGVDLVDCTSDNEDETDSNNPHPNTNLKGRINAECFPKMINNDDGVNPFYVQKANEMKDRISYKNTGSIVVPNKWWGITHTPQYIICSKWNEFYDPIFRVIIEKDSNVKVFIKGRECVNEIKKVSFENISSLLKEVDAYKICAGIDDKYMTQCLGHLEIGSQRKFSIWCIECLKTKKKRKKIL